MSLGLYALLAGSLLATVLGLYAIPRLARARTVAMLRKRCAEKRALCFTYDDGPGEPMTRALLGLFEQHSVAATFFPKGIAADAAPELLDAALDAGHEIGCHSHRHLHAWKVLPHRARQDALEGYDKLSRWVASDGLYRPPYGKLEPLTWLTLMGRGIRQGWWTLDSGDTWAELPGLDETLERIRSEGGGVILMHDMHADPARQAFTLALTERLLRCIESGEFTSCTLGSLMPRSGSAHAFEAEAKEKRLG